MLLDTSVLFCPSITIFFSCFLYVQYGKCNRQYTNFLDFRRGIIADAHGAERVASPGEIRMHLFMRYVVILVILLALLLNLINIVSSIEGSGLFWCC
ncbi:hypothetical protein Dimus_008255 [Dionaea muscipula]